MSSYMIFSSQLAIPLKIKKLKLPVTAKAIEISITLGQLFLIPLFFLESFLGLVRNLLKQYRILTIKVILKIIIPILQPDRLFGFGELTK